MTQKKVTSRGTLRTMRQVLLPELLTRRRSELAKLMPQGKLSQQDIANRAGLSKMGISHLESGRSKPSPEIAPAVAAAYELDEDIIALAVYGRYFEEDTSTSTAPRLEALTA